MIEVGSPTLDYETEIHFIVSDDITEKVEQFTKISCDKINHDIITSYRCLDCPFNGKFESEFKDTIQIREGCLLLYMQMLGERLHSERS